MKIIRQFKNITAHPIRLDATESIHSLSQQFKKLLGIFNTSTGKLSPTATPPPNFSCKLSKKKRHRKLSLLTQSLLILSSSVLIVLTSCAPSSDTAAAPPDNPTLLANLIKSSNPTISGLEIASDNSDPANPKLTIAGLTNNVSGAPVTATITIDQSQGITTDPASFTITAERLISPHTVTTPLTVTFEGEAAASYTVTTEISGAAVSDWFTAATLSTYITETKFAAETGTLVLDGMNLKLSGGNNFTNVPNGAVSLTVSTLPTGYTLTGAETLTVPAGDGFAAVTEASVGIITITETDNPANKQDYPVTITLEAYRSPLTPENITATYNNTLAATSDITVETNMIAISGFTNKNNGAAGSLTVPQNKLPDPLITLDPTSLTIPDPNGTNSTNTNIGMITVNDGREGGVSVSHTVTVNFLGEIRLIITSTDINSGAALTINSGTIITIGTGACQLLAAPTVTVAGINGSKVADATPFPRYYDRERDALDSGMHTVTRRLTLEDGNTNVLSTNFTIMMKFPECTINTITGSGNTGSPYEIDNAPKLELVSHLVNTVNSYRTSHYKITNNIDMGLPGLPFSEMGSKTHNENRTTGKGFIPIGRDNARFSGNFDCGSKTISNLYINRPNQNNIGLIGYTTNNAVISNCYLNGVNITGNDRVGGLVGWNGNNSTISDSYTIGTVLGTGNASVGGLVGLNTGNSTINNSYARGIVSGNRNVGGLVGYNDEGSTISRSYAMSDISGDNQVGGLVGWNSTSTITDSYAIGNVTGNRQVGGFLGANSALSIPSLSFSSVSTITNSYAIVDVTGTSTIDIGLFIGSIAEYNGDTELYNPISTGVTDSYFNNGSTFMVDGSTAAAKGVGSDTSSVMTANLTGLSTANLQVAKGTASGQTYFTWDSNIWDFTAGQYPRLKTVVCANRQYNQDASDCTSMLQ